MLRTGSKYWIILFGVWKFQSLTSFVNLFTFYVLQGPAAADPVPSSNLSATKCSNSKVSNFESKCLTITLGFSFHLFICIDVTEKFWDFSQTLPIKVICIHPLIWYFNPLSLLFSFQAAPAVGSVKPADKSAKKSSRAKVNRLDIKDAASLSNSLAALRIILDNLNSSLEHDLTFIKSSVSGLTAWKVPSSLPSSCGRCKHCQTSRQAC